MCALEDVAAGVEVARSGLRLLEAAGPVGFYSGETESAAGLREAAADAETEFGPVTVGVGIADGGAVAMLAARADIVVPDGGSAQFLGEFDVTVLAPPTLASALRRLGITTLRAFAVLPAAFVATRFGAAGARVHRLARGLDERDPTLRRPPRDLS